MSYTSIHPSYPIDPIGDADMRFFHDYYLDDDDDDDDDDGGGGLTQTPTCTSHK